MKQKIVIATRKSALAMVQAELIKAKLLAHYPDVMIELLGLSTLGDAILDKSLSKIGGKGLFVKELEKALLEGYADIAVHSMKDVPMTLPDGLEIPCILDREDYRDVLVSDTAFHSDMVVGTSSVRRKAQLLALYPGLQIQDVRGNVQTRLQKLDDGQFDAIILAAAGLKRLGLEHRIQEYFSVEQLLPSPGQGALGIECRSDDVEMREMLSVLHDDEAECCVRAERQISLALEASCQLPLAALATCTESQFTIKAQVALPDGSQVISITALGDQSQSNRLTQQVVDDLLAQGGREILEACR